MKEVEHGTDEDLVQPWPGGRDTINTVVVEVKEMGAGEKAEARKAGADAARKNEQAR